MADDFLVSLFVFPLLYDTKVDELAMRINSGNYGYPFLRSST